jgi:hypothetical protein
MWQLEINTQTEKLDVTRYEYFGSPEAADRRRRFLKSIERKGSSNWYKLIETETPIRPAYRTRMRKF